MKKRYGIKSFVKKWAPPFLFRILKGIKDKSLKNTLYFQVHLTYHCNLKCKCCSHFSAISEEKNLDINVLENDFRRLSVLGGGKIRQIDLLGGEPLLHPQICECIIIARKYFRKSRIVLITNGIFLPAMSEKFWKTCNENEIVISLSHYPISLDLDNINEKAKNFDVELIYNSYKDGRKFGHFRMDISGSQNEIENVNLCFESKNCNCLDNGRMFLCYLPACVDIFNTQFNKNIPVSEKDYLDIYKANSISEILKFLKKPVPFCKYCDVKGRNLTKWGISKKVIEEWI